MNEIRNILVRYPTDCRPLDVEPLGSAGGMSGAVFWRLTTPRGRLALRRWPAEHSSPERLKFIHAVLRHAAEQGVNFIPVPIPTTGGESFVERRGYLWELAPWMAGVADYEHAPSTQKLGAALAALARFHVATSNFGPSTTTTLSVGGHAEATIKGPSPNIAKRLGRLRALASSGVSELARAINPDVVPSLAPLAREFLALLPQSLPRAVAELSPLVDVPLRLQPCLRDIWHDHVLFTGDKVTGVIDFGAVDIETPAGDVARLLGSLVGDNPQGWQSGLAAYSAIHPLSEQELRAVTAFDTSGTILAGCNWIRWIYIEGRRFDVPEQVFLRFRTIVERTERLAST